MSNLNLTIARAFLPPPKFKKDRKEYFINYNNRPEIKEKRKIMRESKKNQQQIIEKVRKNQLKSKYSKAENYKVLMSLKEYTELNSAKMKKWLNFVWTFKDLNETGFSDIIQIMKIREEAENLINDYWEIARSEVKKGKNWNNLNPEQKDRLIEYWGQEKFLEEQELAKTLEKQKIEGKKYQEKIDLAKFHEERGKIKCKCYDCENKKEVQAEVKKKIKKEAAEHDQEVEGSEKMINADCANCSEFKKVSTDTGLCKKCSSETEETEEGEEI